MFDQRQIIDFLRPVVNFVYQNVEVFKIKTHYITSSSAMTQRPCEIGDFKGLGQFEAIF